MKTFNAETINSWSPCYPAEKYLDPKDEYNVITLLDRKDIPFEDRLWVIMRSELVSNKLVLLFAVWCARQVQHLMKDERSIKALDVAENFANGMAKKEELDAAWAAAWAAARAAARAAAGATASAAARAAAWATASDAARAAAWATASDAARAAAGAAARATVSHALRATASDAARTAAWAAQETKLRQMLIEGIETGDVK